MIKKLPIIRIKHCLMSPGGLRFQWRRCSLLWLGQRITVLMLKSVMVDLETGKTGTEIVFTLKNRSYSGQEMTPGVRLNEIAACTCGESLFYDIRSLVSANKKYLGLRGMLQDAASGQDSIQ